MIFSAVILCHILRSYWQCSCWVPLWPPPIWEIDKWRGSLRLPWKLHYSYKVNNAPPTHSTHVHTHLTLSPDPDPAPADMDDRGEGRKQAKWGSSFQGSRRFTHTKFLKHLVSSFDDSFWSALCMSREEWRRGKPVWHSSDQVLGSSKILRYE